MIVDFKTGAGNPDSSNSSGKNGKDEESENVTKRKLQELYENQLSIYREAWEKLSGEKVKEVSVWWLG